MIVKKIWFNFKSEKRHALKHVEMCGWFLFGIIPLYIVEVRTVN